MAKKLPNPGPVAPASNEDFEAALKSEVKTSNPDTPLLGIIKTDTGYALVKILVDAKTLETGDAEIIDTAENKWEANEKFKINVIKQGIL